MQNKASLKVGRRTGVNVLSGKTVRIKKDGTDNFNDYWTESSSSSEFDNYSYNGIHSHGVTSPDSDAQESSVQPFLTRSKSFGFRKSGLKSPFAKKSARISLVTATDNGFKKHHKTLMGKSIQTSLKKLLPGANKDTMVSPSGWKSPRRRLNLDKTDLDEPLHHEGTMVNKSINTSPKLQSDGASTYEESELTAPSQYEIRRHLNFDSPNRVSKSSSPVNEKIHKSIGTSPIRFEGTPVHENVPMHSTGISFDQDISALSARLKSGRRTTSKRSVLEDSCMQINVEEHNKEVETSNFESPKHGKRVSNSNSFVHEKSRVSESMSISPALQGSSRLQIVNSSTSHITGTASDHECNSLVEGESRSGEGISPPKCNALEDSSVQGSGEVEIGESNKGSPISKSQKISKIRGTTMNKSINVTPSMLLRSSPKQQNASSNNILLRVSGTPSNVKKSGSQTSVKRKLGFGRTGNTVHETSVIQDSVEIPNKENVKRSEKKNSRSKNVTPASVSRKCSQNVSLNDASLHITTPDQDKSGSLRNVKQNLFSGKNVSMSKSLALEKSVAGNGEKIQNRAVENPPAKGRSSKGKRIHSFILEKTVQDASCNTSGMCTVQKNVSVMPNSEPLSSPCATSLVAVKENAKIQDCAESHQEERVLVASDNAGNDEAVSDHGNVPNETMQEGAAASCLRRSCRNRIPPLAYWRSERRLFRCKADSITNLGLHPGTQEDCTMTDRIKNLREKRKKRKKIKNDSVDFELGTSQPAIFVDSVTGEKTEMKLHSRFKSQVWTIPPSQSGNGKPDYKVCHSLWNENMSLGFVEIAAGCKKGKQYSPNSSLYFVIVQGKVLFEVLDNSYKLSQNDTILVPVATPYSIDNRGKTKALLHFCSTALPFS